MCTVCKNLLWEHSSYSHVPYSHHTHVWWHIIQWSHNQSDLTTPLCGHTALLVDQYMSFPLLLVWITPCGSGPMFYPHSSVPNTMAVQNSQRLFQVAHPLNSYNVEVPLYSLFNLHTRWGRWLMPWPGRFTPRNDTVRIVWETGSAP
jgi:hypothetical protein